LLDGFTLLPDHTTNLPLSMTNSLSDQGDTTLVDHPFFEASAAHWNINTGGRWEVDDFPANAQYDTRHRVWVR
jgi:hypothetical protein